MREQAVLLRWVDRKVTALAEHRVYTAMCELGRPVRCSEISRHLMTKGILMSPNNVNRRLRGLEKQKLVVLYDKNPYQVWITKNRMEMQKNG